MFMLYGVFIGLLLGLAAGGRPGRLGDLRLRWGALMIGGLLFQVVLFSDAVAERVGDLGPLLYVGSSAAVLAAVLRNIRVPGLVLIALGAASNLAAIVANGGFMPASAEALAAAGRSVPEIYSNSAVLANPALAPLTDIFAMPRWLPYANVFSVGDVLITVGVAWAIVAAMRTRPLAGEPVPAAAAVAPEQRSLVSPNEGTDRSFSSAR